MSRASWAVMVVFGLAGTAAAQPPEGPPPGPLAAEPAQFDAAFAPMGPGPVANPSTGFPPGPGTGLLLPEPLGFYRSPTNRSEKVQSFTLGAMWGTATAGLVLADQIRPTRAQVNVVETFGLMGVGSTLLSIVILQPSLDADS